MKVEYSFFVCLLMRLNIFHTFLVILFSIKYSALSLVHIIYLIFTDHVLYVK